MSTTTETRKATCQEEGCTKVFDYEPVVFRGRDLGPPGLCDECGEAKEKREHEEALAEQRREAFQRRVKQAKIPKTFLDIRYPEGTHDAVRDWGAARCQGLYLFGPPGTGKTHAVAAAAWERLRGESIRWASASQLMTQLKMGFDQQESLDAKAIVAGTGGLILDDVDKTKPTEFGNEILFTAIDLRVQAGTPLAITANVSVGELGRRLGGSVGNAVASRLAGYCRRVEMKGSDRRLQR